ncbi:hypothetical protein [Leptospira stimsonii]|uniref:Uncharacterized protein n=1 Tax=Leptospira stimsonii TaxID=2202203 RepID=A0A8B3CQ68_9LEPT|nr:hypothetical protein [Leptospira stimsonii]RHX86152.1 hypothetical protein DLM78_09835 [Leptospira stimsonii]
MNLGNKHKVDFLRKMVICLILTNACSKIDLDSRIIFIARENATLPFEIETEAKKYDYSPVTHILRIRYPIWYLDPFSNCNACRQLIRIVDAEILFEMRPSLIKRIIYEARMDDDWEAWFPNTESLSETKSKYRTNSAFNPQLRKQIVKRLRFQNLPVIISLEHNIDVDHKIILYSSRIPETTLTESSLCLVQKLRIKDCFVVDHPDFDFISLEEKRYLLILYHREGINFKYFEIQNDKLITKNQSISQFSFEDEESVNQFEWEIEYPKKGESL